MLGPFLILRCNISKFFFLVLFIVHFETSAFWGEYYDILGKKSFNSDSYKTFCEKRKSKTFKSISRLIFEMSIFYVKTIDLFNLHNLFIWIPVRFMARRTHSSPVKGYKKLGEGLLKRGESVTGGGYRQTHFSLQKGYV